MAHQPLEERLDRLEVHLKSEHPVLVEAVRLFRELDVVGRRMALLRPDESYATKISWWPLVSILGTFSAGKSSFVNHFLGHRLQRTGNHAVDDKFTVICYGRSESAAGGALPGVALDADPRFPFFRISEELERVSPGEGQRIDAYVQMATARSDRLKGKILIDSPGFDADSQRDEVLRIVEHIMGLSDLVIVMFDARHPEPGAMRDTLKHLVAATSRRADPSKFMFVLNQIDTAAGEDNLEDIVGAWQRCLASEGMTAGRFFTIYNPDAAVEVADAELMARLGRTCSKDLGEVHRRIDEVEVGRAYRIVASLENTASRLEENAVPKLQQAIADWRGGVLKRALLATAIGLVVGIVAAGLIRGWENVVYYPDWWNDFVGNGWLLGSAVVFAVLIALWLHFWNRRSVADKIAARLREQRDAGGDGVWIGDVERAFRHSTRPTRSLLCQRPAGWQPRQQRRAETVKEETVRFVQALNDHYGASTAPSTGGAGSAGAKKKSGPAKVKKPPRSDGPLEPRRSTLEPEWAKGGFRKKM